MLATQNYLKATIAGLKMKKIKTVNKFIMKILIIK